MSRSFLVGVSELSVDKQGAIIERLRKEGHGWWHWISDVWFLSTASEELTANDIYDLFKEHTENANMVVMEFDCKHLVTYGPNTQDRKFAQWFFEHMHLTRVGDDGEPLNE